MLGEIPPNVTGNSVWPTRSIGKYVQKETFCGLQTNKMRLLLLLLLLLQYLQSAQIQEDLV